jgi:N-methylhydantoinase B
LKAGARPERGGSRGSARLEVFRHLFASVADEMGASLQRSSFSPNIKERRDFSCALFDAEGRTIAQAAHIPVHLGAMPLCVAAVRESCELRRGDAVLLNDPYRGGTHLPDVTLVSPVFLGRSRRPSFFCASRAHHADVGGAHPGSMAPADDVHAEGLRVPPIHLVERGRVRRDVLDLVLANLRVPREREGDLLAQWAANRLGDERMHGLAAEHSPSALARHAAGLLEWTARSARALIRSLPDRPASFEDVLDPLPPGTRGPAIRATIRRRGNRLVVDLRESGDQVGGGLNATRAVALSAVVYVLRLLLPAGIPTNQGLLRDVDVLTRPGSLLDPLYPAPVAAGNVETSQRLVDVLLGAFARLLPGRIPAASSGTMSNLSFGGALPDGAFTYYETIAGGAGASREGDGAHAVHTHMTNTRNTPIEAFEQRFPVRVERLTIRRGSGGEGAHRGGDGVVKELRFLAPARAAWIADRTASRPWGAGGGGEGAGGIARVRRGRISRELPGRAVVELSAGDVLSIETPGGGGWGRRR